MPPLLANFIHARGCKPICAKLLTLPWRYRYPEFDTTRIWAKVIPQGLSDMLVEELNKDKKDK